MEKASAACAMDWSIELEKGLRSNKPGQHLESIQLTGHRIQKWCQEPKLKLTIYNMFRMVHGEERLYADAILLRLADAFGAGDRDTKIHIVNIFLSERRDHDRKRRQEYGIFSKMTADNYLELLRRIKVALSDTDIEFKALTLVLFGCWSEIAKDIPEIRYAILSSLLSPHTLEVKASLFAAGCFSELSYDFASAFLEMLISIVASPKTSSTVKTAAAWSFRKMGHFHSLMNKAYKSGSEIVLKSSEDDFLVPMLISLSKLASKSVSLSSEQVSLLCGLPTHKMTPRMQLVVIRCLHHILRKTCHITIGVFSFENLLRILDEKQVPSALKCEVLQLIFMIVLCAPYDMLFLRIQEVNKVLKLVASLIRSSETSDPERVLATRILVGISNKLTGRKQIAASELNILPLLSDVVTSVGDDVILQMKQMPEYCRASEIELELKSLLRFLFHLLEGPLEVSLLGLDKLGFIFEILVNICAENMNATEKASTVRKVFSVEENAKSLLISKFIHYAYKFLSAYIERFYVADATTTELNKLRHLISFVCQCNLFNCSTHVKYALLMYSCCNFSCLLAENGKEREGRCLKEISHFNLGEDRTLSSGCLGNMLAENDNWATYLVGKLAACKGAWFVSESVFAHLQTRCHSDIFSCWLRCLSQFAHSESSLQEMFLQAPVSDSISMLASVCDDLVSSERLLGATAAFKQTFCFQRWFLALRMKVLAVIVDLFKLLATVSSCQEGVRISQQTQGASDTDCIRLLQEREGVMCSLAGISLKLQRIVREYDLMNSSFIDMDQKSFRVISSIALSCSLLALCTGFAYFIPNSPFPEDSKSCSSKDPSSCLHRTLVEDLVARLSHIDPETGMNIISILKGDLAHEASLQSQDRSRSFNIVYEAGSILKVCKAAVEGIRAMQNEIIGTSKECLLPLVSNKGACFLVDIAQEWISIPFQTPKFFFQVRPCVGAVLFSYSLDSENPSDISVLQGSHLSLNLCLQLKNMPPDLHSRITKIFCILHCKSCFIKPHKKPSETTFSDYQSWTTDDMMHLHEKLRWHVMEQAGEELAVNENDINGSNGLVAETYACFETNGGVQGFTTCLLDVSAFPCGSYRIDWQSCCIDDRGSYWSLLSVSPGPFFTVRSSKS